MCKWTCPMFLQESVPVNHRRWAKIHIHNWRVKNLKNATTSSSDSERERRGAGFTKEAAGVPEAYAVWLDLMLPKFHKRWEKSGRSEEAKSDASVSDEEGGPDSLIATLKVFT